MTKVAALWLMSTGVIWLVAWLAVIPRHRYWGDSEWEFLMYLWLALVVLAGSTLVIPGTLLLRRGRVSWWAAVLILTLALVCVVGWTAYEVVEGHWESYYDASWVPTSRILAILWYVAPLALVLRDRKAYRRIAH
jgi:lysylphosphatidylglycerol synthetase-like protein (DUF2156 family)